MPLLFVSSIATAQEQGFAVETGAEVELEVNGVHFFDDQLNTLFSIEQRLGFDKYIARAGAFDGSELLSIRAYAVDEAGNRSMNPSEIRFEVIDTVAPPAPEIVQIINAVSATYASGFELPAGAVPVLSVNDLMIDTSALDGWFSLSTQSGIDRYTARPGLFDGSEVVTVSAWQVDASGNRSADAERLTLFPIDTLAPEAPRVLSLAQLLVEQSDRDAELSAVPAAPSVVAAVEPADKAAVGIVSKRQSDTQAPAYAPAHAEIEVQAPALVQGTATSPTQMPDSAVDNTPELRVINDSQDDLDDLVRRILAEPEANMWQEKTAEPAPGSGQMVESEMPQFDSLSATRVDEIDVEYQTTGFAQQSSELSTSKLNNDRFLDTEFPAPTEPQVSQRDHSETEMLIVQTEISGALLAASNGLDPFEVLNMDRQNPEKLHDEIEAGLSAKLAPKTEVSRKHVFDLRSPNDTQQLIDWMRLEADGISCTILEMVDGGALHEILACLDLIGYPQAQMIELPDGIRIDTGEKMRIKSVGVGQVLAPELSLANSFVDDLVAKPLSKAQHVKAIERLEELGFVRDGSFDYYAREPGGYDAELIGEAGESQLSLGASLTTGGKLFGALKGRHFFDYRGLRYLDYRVGSDIDGKYEIDLSAPLYYDLENQVDIEFKTVPMDYRYFESRTTELAGRWRDFSGKSSLHLAEAGIGVSLHESDPKSAAGVTPQAVADQTLLRADLNADLSPGVVNGDKLSLGVTAGHNLSIGAGYLRADIDYDTGRIPVAQTGFMVKGRVSGSAVLAGHEAVPLDQKLYLGGSDSVRGVKASYLGASKDLGEGGGEQRIVSQVELFKPTTLFDQEVDLGVHFDAGNLSGRGNLEDSSAVSVGLFGRADLSENTSAYAYISRSNVESDAQSLFGISIVRKF